MIIMINIVANCHSSPEYSGAGIQKIKFNVNKSESVIPTEKRSEQRGI